MQLTSFVFELIEDETEAWFESAMEALESLSRRQRDSLSGLLRLVLTTQDD